MRNCVLQNEEFCIKNDWTLQKGTGGNAYTCFCRAGGWEGPLSPQNATLGDLLGNGDGTNAQRTMRAQYGFTAAQLAWPVVTAADYNFASNLPYLKASACDKWDQNSIALKARPFAPVGSARPWHSRTYEDYQVAPDSELVTQHGFKGSFNVSEIGLTNEFTFVHAVAEAKRRDAYGLIHAERYDRTKNLWTSEAQGLGSGVGTHFQKDPAYTVPAGSWARFDGVDFGAGGEKLSVTALAQSAAGGATIRFQLGSPDASGELLASVDVAVSGTGWELRNGTAGEVVAPAGVHPVFMVFEHGPSAPVLKPDDKAHRYWRITAQPADFNHSFYVGFCPQCP